MNVTALLITIGIIIAIILIFYLYIKLPSFFNILMGTLFACAMLYFFGFLIYNIVCGVMGIENLIII